MSNEKQNIYEKNITINEQHQIIKDEFEEIFERYKEKIVNFGSKDQRLLNRFFHQKLHSFEIILTRKIEQWRPFDE